MALTCGFVLNSMANRRIWGAAINVTFRHMADRSSTVRYEGREESINAGVVDLQTQLNRAYLAGDGAAVERVMAMLAELSRPEAPRRGAKAA